MKTEPVLNSRAFQGGVAVIASLLCGYVAAPRVDAAEPLSRQTATMFSPDGIIDEFINDGGDSQLYFIASPDGDPQFGAILSTASLTRGVFVIRDNFPGVGDINEAGPSGFRDLPGASGTDRLPTGFNIGRVFASYNPDAFSDSGGFFFAFDNTAPAVMDPINGTQPIAFDVDGNGSRTTQTEINAGVVSEAPTSSSQPDIYAIELDFDFPPDAADFVVLIEEQRRPSTPAGSVDINPGGVAQVIDTFTVQRFLTIEPPFFPIDPVDRARVFMDINGDNVVNHLDVGIDEDVEVAVRNAKLILDPAHPMFGAEACVNVTFVADSFDDVNLGGGAEERVSMVLRQPLPDLEVTKLARCVDDSVDDFRTTVRAVPGSQVEFQITIQNWGNRDLLVSVDDALTNVAPATVSLVPGSCQTVGAVPAGVVGTFCADFEAALASPALFPIEVGVLRADDECFTRLGETFSFRFTVDTGPAAGNSALCDQGIDITNAVSVTGTTAVPCVSDADCVTGELCLNNVCTVNAIFGPDPTDPAAGADDEEEDSTGNGVGDVDDEFTITVQDLAGVSDTSREQAGAGDDNRAFIELECRGLTFEKQVVPDSIGDDPATYPLQVEYRFIAMSDASSEVNQSVTIKDPTFCADVLAAAGADAFISCPICVTPAAGVTNPSLAPGGNFTSICTIEFDTPAEAMALMTADQGRPDDCVPNGQAGDDDESCYRNCATATAGIADQLVCDGVLEFADDATLCVEQRCFLEVEKTVQCLDSCTGGSPVGSPVSAPEDPPLMVTEGSCAQFGITATNTGSASIHHVCILDEITCNWPISSITATIDRSAGPDEDVTSCFSAKLATGLANGSRQCFNFEVDCGTDPLRAGERLIITFNVEVPDPHAVLNRAVDCRNTVTIDGYESRDDDTSEEPDETCTDTDSAEIDVKVPEIECGKRVSVDLGNDGIFEFSNTTLVNITTATFPMRVVYTLSAENTGELAIIGAKVCDSNLVAHAVAAGATVGPCGLCNDPAPCDGAGDDCASLGNLAPGSGPVSVSCEIVFDDLAQWTQFAGSDLIDGRQDCYTNVGSASGTVEAPCAPDDFNPNISSTNSCTATVCLSTVPDCPTTKAKFDVWNQNEVRFSGTERCIISWDQKLLSEYTPRNVANNLLRMFLQTNKGKARIDGVASPTVCGSESEPAPLLGVAAKVLRMSTNQIDMSGRTLVGMGTQAGVIKYDLPGDPSPLPTSPSPPSSTMNRASVTKKGSLLFFAKVEIKWDAAFNLVQDTFLDLSNDSEDDVRVQLYLVNGDQPTPPIIVGDPPEEIERAHLGCNAVDVDIPMTGDEPTYWSALTGDPKGVTPFTILDPGFPPGRPDTDPLNPGGRVLRGYVLAWAVNAFGEEIKWNNLSGDATIVNYAHGLAWEYNAWAFQAIAGAAEGDLLASPKAQLNLDGSEYDFPPDKLLLDFFASGSLLTSGPHAAIVDTDLTLWAALKDLRAP